VFLQHFPHPPFPQFVPTTAPSTFTPTVTSSYLPTFAPAGSSTIPIFGSSYIGTGASEYFEIHSTVDVKITGGGGNDYYLVLVHNDVNITITDFSNGFNILDLSNFPAMTDFHSVLSRDFFFKIN
jgi:hypothetical protein